MNKNLCTVPDCRDFGRYCRQHLTDEPTEEDNLEKLYLKEKAKYLKEHPVCLFGTCKKPSNDVHHKKGRGKKYKADPQTFLAVCRGHHKFLEEHPNFAKANGYSLSRLSKENKTV